MLKNRFLLIALLGALEACSTTPSNLEAKTEARTQTYTENYQEIFRRVSNAAKRCQSGNVNAYASMDVDAQIYSELGYGEISQSLVNAGIRNYYWTAKIEKTDAGSKMTAHSGNTLSAGQSMKMLFKWADGYEGCM